MLLALLLFVTQSAQRAECPDVQACRQAALAAAARQDFETFHDFAWRAVQKGKPNDPELMYLLARAQSLSGRPGDALVMLERLARMGVATDAATNDDFRRVRALPGWTKFEQPVVSATPATPPPSKAAAAASASDGPKLAAAAGSAAEPGNSDAALAFVAAPFTAAGLAYDSVSRRFVVGDRFGRRLLIVDEPSHNVATLVSAPSAGFADVTALEIDHHEGDLWVASASTDASTLHKLQLVSGRLIYSIAPPTTSGPVRLVDIAITPGSTVLALDAAGRRLFATSHGSRAMRELARLDGDVPTSLAPSGDDVCYVADRRGIARLELKAHEVTRVKPARSVDITGVRRLRMHRGALIAIQEGDEGHDRLVRIHLNASGTAAMRVDVIRPNIPAAAVSTASLADDDVYYLDADDGATSVRRISIK